MNTNCPCGGTDHGASPWAVRMAAAAHENTAFRSAVWTGSFLQLTLMHIPPCGEIGLECHPETDQFVRVEEGCALLEQMVLEKDLPAQDNFTGILISCK